MIKCSMELRKKISAYALGISIILFPFFAYLVFFSFIGTPPYYEAMIFGGGYIGIILFSFLSFRQPKLFPLVPIFIVGLLSVLIFSKIPVSDSVIKQCQELKKNNSCTTLDTGDLRCISPTGTVMLYNHVYCP